jgi:hypothetical protein
MDHVTAVSGEPETTAVKVCVPLGGRFTLDGLTTTETPARADAAQLRSAARSSPITKRLLRHPRRGLGLSQVIAITHAAQLFEKNAECAKGRRSGEAPTGASADARADRFLNRAFFPRKLGHT